MAVRGATTLSGKTPAPRASLSWASTGCSVKVVPGSAVVEFLKGRNSETQHTYIRKDRSMCNMFKIHIYVDMYRVGTNLLIGDLSFVGSVFEVGAVWVVIWVLLRLPGAGFAAEASLSPTQKLPNNLCTNCRHTYLH